MRTICALIVAVLTAVVELRMSPMPAIVWGAIVALTFVCGLVMAHKPRAMILWIYMGFAAGTSYAQVALAH